MNTTTMSNTAINFVTGGTGFVGSYLLRQLLAQGKTIRATKRTSSPMHLVADIADQVEWVTGDILDTGFLEEVMEGVSDVYHAAAMISFDPREVDRMMEVNVKGTANVVNIALHHGIRKLVHVSSIAALGRIEHQPHIDEKSSWQTSKLNSNYAISKFSAECEVWRGMEEGLNAAVINPSVILGGGYWNQGSCKLFKKIDEGLSFYPKGQTGFVDVRDVARSMIVLMESDIQNERFVVNGDNLLYKDFLSRIAKALGKTPPSKKASKWLTTIAIHVESLRSKLTGSRPLITKETVSTSAHIFEYDSAKIKELLGFEFIPIQRCIEETCALMRKGKEFGVLA